MAIKVVKNPKRPIIIIILIIIIINIIIIMIIIIIIIVIIIIIIIIGMKHNTQGDDGRFSASGDRQSSGQEAVASGCRRYKINSDLIWKIRSNLIWKIRSNLISGCKIFFCIRIISVFPLIFNIWNICSILFVRIYYEGLPLCMIFRCIFSQTILFETIF